MNKYLHIWSMAMKMKLEDYIEKYGE